MKASTLQAIAFASVALGLTACSSDRTARAPELAPAAPALDPYDVRVAAPEHYRVLVENAHVRVVECTLGPGEKDRTHTHPAGWYRVTRAGTMRVRFVTGKESTWRPAQDESGWMDAEAAHVSENIGDAPMSFVLVEVKSAARPAGGRVPE